MCLEITTSNNLKDGIFLKKLELHSDVETALCNICMDKKIFCLVFSDIRKLKSNCSQTFLYLFLTVKIPYLMNRLVLGQLRAVKLDVKQLKLFPRESFRMVFAKILNLIFLIAFTRKYLCRDGSLTECLFIAINIVGQEKLLSRAATMKCVKLFILVQPQT